MAIPDERKIPLSTPTKTAMKGLRDAVEISLCRSAMRRDIFEIYFTHICNLRSVRIGHSDQVAGIGGIELVARAFIQHVRVDTVGAQQRDALLALGTLPLQPRQFRRQRDDLLVELLPRVQPILAGVGVDAEI